MHYASISVGIVQYAARYYRESNMRLRFAASDAIAFHRYLEKGSQYKEDNFRHILITDGEATKDGVSAAFAQLATSERVDVLIVYLSGHGERGNDDGGWFCLADAEPGKCSLGGAQLDALLDGINAMQVLVVVDCCHAEAMFRRAQYFTQLGTSQTRLLIASARAHQQAWEDASLSRSVFSEVLLRGCSSELHLQNAGGMVDVERTLFPYLRAQVVLLTAANKNGLVQEPITGGLAALPLMLHSVRSSAFGRSLSLSDTLRARLRQILIGIASTAMAILTLVHIMTYHLVADSTGNIQVRMGFVSTAGLLPASLVSQIDTGYSLAHLDPRKTAFLSALSRGEVRGIGSHIDDLGLKSWSYRLAPFLKSSVHASYDIVVRGRPAQFDPIWSAAPLAEAQFLLSRNTGMPAGQLGLLYAVEQPNPPRCMTSPAGKIDFSSLNPSAKVASEETIWWALRAGRPTGDQLAAFDDLIALTAYRSFHHKDSASTRYEAANLALALLILTSQATDQTLAEMQKHAMSMLPTHCRLHAALALGLIASDVQSGPGGQAEAVFAFEISQYDRVTQGGLANGKQEMAIDALMLLAQRRRLNAVSMGVIAELVRNDAGDIGGGTFPQRILLSLAEHQALPDTILKHIDERFQRLPKDGNSFEKLGIVRVLSRNVRFLSADRRLELKRLLTRMGRTDNMFHDYHEALGFAGLAGPEPGTSIGILNAQLSPATLFAVPAATYRGDTLISSNGDTAAIALGRMAQAMKLDASMQERLGRLAAARADLPNREALIAGLAYQHYGTEEMIADAIYGHLAAASADARQRSLEVEVACTALVGRLRQTRHTISERLLARWDQESAPELRHALALTIGRTRFPAIGQLNLCRDLSAVVAE